MKRKIIIISVSVLSVLILAGGLALYNMLLGKPFTVDSEKYIYIDSNDNIDSVFHKVETTLKPKSMTGFRMLAKIKKYDRNIFTGAYKIGPQTTTLSAFRKLQAGHQTPVRLVVPSVRTIEKLAKNVSRQIMADSASIASLLNDSCFLDSLGYSKATVPALFIPNTYEVYWNMTAEGFVKRMNKEYKSFWNKERTAKAQEIGFTPVEVSILASIVEEETANNAEKPVIAGLYINRLKKGIPLQADPTIKFSLQDFGLKRILFKHLEAESPYNTYKYAGLPPGPIRIPSITGLNSVLNYSKHNYIYMCAKEDFSGTHNFATTLNEHNRNAARYQRALNQRNIK